MPKSFCRVTLFLLALSLYGCAAVDAAKNYVDERERVEEEERFAVAKEACGKYGFHEGTDAYSNCLQAEVNNIKNREAIRSAASVQEPVKQVETPKTTNCIKTLMGMQCSTQ